MKCLKKIQIKKKTILIKRDLLEKKDKLKEKVGKKYNCLIENITEDGELLIGRSYMDVPSEDGVIYIKNDNDSMINEFVDVLITDSSEYDLFGEVSV